MSVWRSGSLIKALWHDGVGLSPYAKRLAGAGRFIWPSKVGGVVHLSGGQMSYLLEEIDWRSPRQSWRPTQRDSSHFFGCRSIFCFTPGRGYDSVMVMQASVSPMPDDVQVLKAALAAARTEIAQAKAGAATVRAERSDDQALIAHLKLQIEKLKHQLIGTK